MNIQPLFWDVLESRRSIRKFKSDPVSKDQIDRILAAGVLAPNAMHRQSWRFVVITSLEEIAKLADALNVNFRQDMLALGKPKSEVETLVSGRKDRICAAPAVIVMFVDTEEVDNYSEENLASGKYLMAVQSCALAGGQMLLAADALGLGGLWMGGPIYAPQNVRVALNLPASWVSQGMLLIGYANEAPEKKARKPMDSVVRFIGK
jgi:coenzyme F420-0:L-glutamate ligase/coenzyme F420-1:gamma-L-glutamate ligase